MTYYRVPFFGTLLVEADSLEMAGLVAGSWSVSMKQATHGVEMQPISPEIKAVEYCIERSKREDVTEELEKSMQEDEKRATENPGGNLLAKMFVSHSHYVGLQAAWESCEFERMRPESERNITS